MLRLGGRLFGCFGRFRRGLYRRFLRLLFHRLGFRLAFGLGRGGRIVGIGHGIGLGMLTQQTLLLGLLFFSAALFLLTQKLGLQLFGRLCEFVRVFAHGRYPAQHIFRALQQFPGGILEFHFGHCSACTPA